MTTEKVPHTEVDDTSLDSLGDVSLQIRLIMGQVDLTIGELLKLKKGSVIPLEKEKNEPFELHANGNHVASGEVVVVNEKYGVRITHIVDPDSK